uniref:Uncharacterized protein n=1 Tax=Setaria italica TaxID=4555 RepID=K3YXG4_SETIT
MFSFYCSHCSYRGEEHLYQGTRRFVDISLYIRGESSLDIFGQSVVWLLQILSSVYHYVIIVDVEP